MIRIGVIGCGARAASMINCMRSMDGECALGMVADPDERSARKRLTRAEVPHESTQFFADAESLVARAGELDGIMVGTRCDLHTPMAIEAAKAGLPVFLEKPVGVTMEQLEALNGAYVGKEATVVVSFPLRLTPLFVEVERIIALGRLGTINQIQAVNYVPYGGVYFGQWYRDYDVTHGLWLQKATHDFDCINRLVRARPISVAAMSTHKIYGGDMPEDLRCSSCDIREHCPESPEAIAARNDDGGMGRDDHACAFSDSIKHQDAGSALIMYDDGTHAAYSQNFVSRRSAAARGARITGYLGTLSFDWYTESIQIIEHHGTAVENVKVTVPSGHHGGDTSLARNFIDVMRGADVSRSTLRDGIVSAAMCVAANESEKSGRVERVVWSQKAMVPAGAG